MFNQFNKKKEDKLLRDVLSDITTNQKMSVMNLLLIIGGCDGEQGNQDKELQYLNTFVDVLDVRCDNSMDYLKKYGHKRIVEDLQSLSKTQKEFLVVAAWDMIICDGRPNEIENQVTLEIFEKIGVSEEQFVAIIKKSQALMNQFGK